MAPVYRCDWTIRAGTPTAMDEILAKQRPFGVQQCVNGRRWRRLGWKWMIFPSRPQPLAGAFAHKKWRCGC